MAAYYNEIDPFAAQWLRNLIAAGHIAPGDVDTRSIADVDWFDLIGYDQCHFFAGIGVWSHALRLAGWPDDKPVWTGSCPCQPFSAAGKRKGMTDERHLWPEFYRLIRKHRPPVVFGEQVAAAIRGGWLDLVFSDLEGEGYACGAVDFPACSVGAPHIRQRIYFVAESVSAGAGRDTGAAFSSEAGSGRTRCADGMQRSNASIADSATRELADAEYAASERDKLDANRKGEPQKRRGDFGSAGNTNFWSDLIWLPCLDGKARPTQPSIFPLAHGAASRVGRLRAYGNAIVAPQAAEFIRAFMACRP